MRVVLVQQIISKAIIQEFLNNMTDDQKTKADEPVYTSIILHFSNQVLRKIRKTRFC